MGCWHVGVCVGVFVWGYRRRGIGVGNLCMGIGVGVSM